MTITVKCPTCGQHQAVAGAANSVMQCIACGNRFRVPAVRIPPQPTVPLATLATSSNFCTAEQETPAFPGIVWAAIAGAAAVALLCLLMLVSLLRPRSEIQALAGSAGAAGERGPTASGGTPPPNSAPSAQAPVPPVDATSLQGRTVSPPTPAPSPQAQASSAAPASSSAPDVAASDTASVSPRRTTAPTYVPPTKKEELAWGVKPDPAPNTKWLRRPMELKEGHLQTILFSRSPATMAVTHSWQHGERTDPGEKGRCKHWLNAYDVKKGSHIKNVPLELATSPADYDLLAVMPDGKQALVSARKRNDSHSTWLQMIDLATGEVALEWEPLAGQIMSDLSAAFIDADLVLVAHKEQLTLWEISTQTPTPFASAACFAVSPNGKFIAAGGPDRITFFNAASREPCGELSCRGKPVTLAFSLEGDRLASLMAGTVTSLECWNLNDGSVTADFPLGIKYFFMRGRPALQWCGPEHVLLDGKWLIDLTRGVAVWRYSASKVIEASPDESCWYTDHVTVRRRSGDMLCELRLPDMVAKQRIERVYSQARQIVGPGSQVSLKLSLPQVASIPDYAQRVRKLFTDQLAESNITVADGQPVVLEVSAAPLATGETHTFKPFGSHKNVAPMQVAGQKVDWRATISAGGRVYWERTGTSHNVGFISMVHLKPGETLDQNVTKQMWDGTLFFFKSIGMPSRVFDVVDSDGFGESRLTAAGAEARMPIELP